MDRKYAIDANVLITSSRTFYSFEIAPSFWNQLVEKGKNKIILIDKVRDEIYKNEDQLSLWLKENENFFIIKSSADENIIKNYSLLITCVQENQQYKASAKSQFAEEPDFWLCAHAMTYNYMIVTQEKYKPNIKKKVKIPNVCKEFNIEYIDLFQFIKEIGIRLG